MRTVLQSLVSVVGGEAALRAANFAMVLFIARHYGGTTLGAYAATLAVVTTVLMFADSGLQTAAITQSTSSTAADRSQIAGQLTLCKTILLIVAAVLLLAVGILTKQTKFVLSVGLWITVRGILQSYSQLQLAFLKSASRAKWIGIIQFLHSAFLFLGIWLAFTHAWNVLTMLEWFTSGQLAELLLATAVLLRCGVWPGWPERLHFFAIVKMAAPFGIAYGLANLIVRGDTIVLSAFASLAEVGAFSAANTVLVMVYVSSWLFGTVLLPEMMRLSEHPENVRLYANRWARWVLFITVPCTLAVSIAAPGAIAQLYGPAFTASGPLASVMVLACPLILLNSVYTTLTIASNSRGALLGIHVAGALVTLALDYVLGRAFGAMGIAFAILVREAAMLLALWLLAAYLPSSWLNDGSDPLPGEIASNPPVDRGIAQPQL